MAPVSRGRQAPVVKLSKKERESLEALIRRGTAAQRDVERARIALLVDDGHTTSAIASALGLSRPTVTLWRERLACFGVEGLQEAPRPGRPRRIEDAQRLQLLALACEPAEDEGRATPTLDELCERAVQRGVVEGISRSHLQRILQAGDVRPHRVRQWLHSPDPQFREKVNVICETSSVNLLQADALTLSVAVSKLDGRGLSRWRCEHPGPGLRPTMPVDELRTPGVCLESRNQ